MRDAGELRRQPALELPARALALAAALLAVAAGPALAQNAQRTLTTPASYDRAPRGWERSAHEAIAAGARAQRIAAELGRHGDDYPRAFQVGRSRRDPTRRWLVSWYVPVREGEPDQVAQALVEDATGDVLEAWTGVQVEWSMARGYPGAFGRKVNAPYVWLGLCLAFLLPFLRGPPRLLHLDLLVLLSLGVSYALFNDGRIDWSVPLSYPPLLYLLARALWLARRGPPAPLRTWMSLDALVIAIVFLVGFRLGLNYAGSNVIDVGYSGVIGADRITSGEALYGNFPSDNDHGDTYGPFAYLAYVPFELVAPWRGVWDNLPAAHLAAAFFDLATAAGLFALGRRLRDAHLGALMAYLWLAFPFSVLVANSAANDALVGALLVAVLLAHARPAARGALAALAGMTKLAPLALVPLLWTGPGSRARFLAALALAAVAVTVPVVAGGGLDAMYERTVGFQAGRNSPFSVWGLYDLGVLRDIAQWVVAALALSLALTGRRRGVHETAALAAAVLIALGLTAGYWFYSYLAWWVPLLLVALLAPQVSGRSTGSIEAARLVPSQRTSTPISHGSSSAES